MAPVEVEIGFAAAEGDGRGIAYARLRASAVQQLLRVGFRMRAGFAEGEIGYAALTAVAQALRKRGLKSVALGVDDWALVSGLSGGDIPEAAVLPYVRLKCALNRFDEVKVTAVQPGDLAQRARAEVALLPAA